MQQSKMAENISNDFTENREFCKWAQESGLTDETTKVIADALRKEGYTLSDINKMTDRSLNEFLDRHIKKLLLPLVQCDAVEHLIKKIKANPDKFKSTQSLEQLSLYQHDKKEHVVERCVNIAVIGYANSGKSAFIQAMRGERCSEDAPPSSWIDPVPGLIRPYDIPGTGIFLWEIQLQEEYESDHGKSLPYHVYSWYDAIIICSRDSYFDKNVVNSLQPNDVLYFVRTNVDVDLHSCKDDNIQNFNATEQLEKIRQEAHKHLQTSKHIYLVNSKVPSEHDFPKIKNKIIPTECTKYARSIRDKLLLTVIPKATELCRMGKFDKDGITKEIRNYEERFEVTLPKDDLSSYFAEYEKMPANPNGKPKSRSHIHWTIHILMKYLRRCETACIRSLRR